MKPQIKYTDPSLKPSELIVFTKEYKDDIALLKEQLQKACIDKTSVLVTTKRLDLKKGTFTTRQNYGKIISTNGVSFEMLVEYTFVEGGGKTVLNSKQTFRFDSYLGEIPVSAETIIPCEINYNLHTGYANFLDEFKNGIKPYIGTSTKFNFQYQNFFVDGMSHYYLNASVTEVNVSNFGLHVAFSHGITKSGHYYNTIERNVIRPFLTPQTLFTGIAA